MGIQLVVSDPETGRAEKFELDDRRSAALFGKRIGDVIDGAIIGKTGWKLKITGGTDVDGVPMKPGLPGTGRRALLLSGGVGFHPRRRGERRRKLVRGEVVSPFIRQLNVVIISKGKEERAEEKKKSEEATEQ
ncbi:30S ribosomal protein S6e [archaeon]|nr:30S ribosomal protein S6e [archaeon]